MVDIHVQVEIHGGRDGTLMYLGQVREKKEIKSLKVDGNKKEGGQEGDSKSASVWHYGDRGLFEI